MPRDVLAQGMARGQLARARAVLDGGPLGRRAGSKCGRPERERAVVALEYMQSACGWLGWLTNEGREP